MRRRRSKSRRGQYSVGNISPQLWSVRIPCWAAENGSKLVRIPRGQDSLDLPLPAGVTHAKLKNTSGTTIGSSGIGEDVIDDDAEHEFRTKFKADHLGTKGRQKM
ncbi:RING/U-box superfamily protein [Prunus dulcis]|uniref:RING/U-box superfamily protein n=1 Tax=Prunus dulcis TaxID=3755 RepID=A0A4Y1R9K0_PRUDU|nr:RING/U-box superfamily protein [Prunus dulcis]